MNTKEHDKRHRSRRSRSLRTSVFSRIRRKRSGSPIKREWSRSPRQRAKEGGVFKRLGSRGKSVSARSDSYNHHSHSRYTEALSESDDSRETYPFTLRIRYFDFPKTRMPSHIKTYDGSEDLEDHLKIIQAAAKTERWAMPTRCHMFYSTLTGNARVRFDDLSPESIDSYDDLKKAFPENYIQQKKYIKDPIELYNIKQRDGKFTEDFVRRSKLESRDVKGASECMGIFGFMHGSTNPEFIKRLHDKIPKMVDEMMRVTTSFLRGELAASNHERKKSFPPWKQHEGNRKQNFKKGGFQSQQMSKRKQDRFSLLTKTPKEIFALEKGKFKAPPPMTSPVEKQNYAEFCEFYGEVGHNTDECMHLRKQIEEMLKARKLSYLIKEIKQNNGKEQPKVTKKGETSEKDKSLAILMVQPWERVARQRITQSFSPNLEIFFHPSGKMRERKLQKLCMSIVLADFVQKLKKQLIPTTTPLIGFSGEIIWPIGKIQLFVKIGDEEHSALAWMNVMVVRSQSPYNGIIRRPGVRKLQAVSSIAHGMLKIPVESPSSNKPGISRTNSNDGLYPHRGRPNKLCGLLQRNLEIFAWKPADMTGVPRHIAEHRLNVREGCSLVRQKKREQEADRNQAIQEEVGKLVGAGIMRELHYHDWLSNPVMVKKHDGSWRMCIDFKDLNKAYPKDGYHQIQMATKDEDKTAFITSHGIFRYTKMPFGLRNDRATYQHLVDKAFHKQIARNLEVYVDVLVIKNRTKDEIVKDVEETFKTLREINMKLNPKKCAFGVEEVMLLGYKVNDKGLKVCPDKVDAVLSLPSPKCLKDVQKLNRKLASLNRTNTHKPRRDGVHLCSKIQENVDSRLVANQVNGTYVAKEADMIRYLENVIVLTGSFKAFSIKQIPRSENKKADALSKIASTSFTHLSKQVLVEKLKEKSISEVEILAVVEEEGDTWMTSIFKYLMEETLPADVKKARAIKRKSWRFAVVNETLYKKYFLGPWLRCVGPLQTNYVLKEVHEGSCSMHAGILSVVAKSLRTGYYWPTMHKDARILIRACPGKVKFLIVVMDYFTKWIEAKLVATITGNQIKKFVWDNVVCRFGLPGEIISDNGKQFRTIRSKIGVKNYVVIPAEMCMPTPRTVEVDLVGNNEALEINLDLLEERKEEAAIREAKSKAKMKKYYNSKVRNTSFTPGDLVYRNNDASRVEDTGKLGPKWEGPYEVMERLEKARTS
nr:hypothetical protein [Tanacetum cinerariifolium]